MQKEKEEMQKEKEEMQKEKEALQLLYNNLLVKHSK